MNSKTRILLEYCSFHGQSVDEVWSLFGAHLNLRSLVVFLDIFFLMLVHFMLELIMPPFWYDMCSSLDHDSISCLFYVCYVNLIYPYL